MKVIEFAIKNNFSNLDQQIVKKMYGDIEKSEKDWFLILKDKIKFDTEKYLKLKKSDIVKKIVENKKKNKKITKN